MNAKEANKIVNAVETNDQQAAILLSFGKFQEGDYNKAKGYLEALSQMEPIIKDLEDIRDHSGIPGFNDSKWSSYCHLIAFNAVAHWKELQKETLK